MRVALAYERASDTRLLEIDAQPAAESARTADRRAGKNAFERNQVEFIRQVFDVELACEPNSIVKLELPAD